MSNKRLKIFILLLVVLGGMFQLPALVSADATEPFVGEIDIFAFNIVPKGWMSCDGQLLPISSNTALFSLLGATYGGDGKSTFALPDLNGTNPLGVNAEGEERGNYCIAVQGIYPPRN